MTEDNPPSRTKRTRRGIAWLSAYTALLALLWRFLSPIVFHAGPLFVIGFYLVFIIGGFFGLVFLDRRINGRPTEPYNKHLAVSIGFAIGIFLIGIVLASLLFLLVPGNR